MSPPARAGIIVTGTEVLSGRVRDRNGPWLSERLFEQGIELAHIAVVGDRPADMESALRFMAAEGMDAVVTSGGLGPTADDLTAEAVGRFQGREMVLDTALERRIAQILEPLAARYPHLDRVAIAAGNRKQATIPRGASVLAPVGTAPGLVVAPAEGRDGPTVAVLPGPPRELQPMWRAAIATDAWRRAVANARDYRQRMLRLFGIPESEIAETMRAAERDGVRLDALEITTCLRGGEIEVVTRYEPAAQDAYDAFAAIVAERHADTLYSRDGSTVDDQVAALLRGEGAPPLAGSDARRIAVAESCSGGLLAARLTKPPGASRYVLGGIVAYSDELKIGQLGVAAETIARHGAVSEQVAREMAAGARRRLNADVAASVTGVAGPGGGSERKPVGLVWLSVQAGDGSSLTRSVRLPGGREDVRERAVTVAMHMIRRVLSGERDDTPAEPRESAGPLLR